MGVHDSELEGSLPSPAAAGAAGPPAGPGFKFKSLSCLPVAGGPLSPPARPGPDGLFTPGRRFKRLDCQRLGHGRSESDRTQAPRLTGRLAGSPPRAAGVTVTVTVRHSDAVTGHRVTRTLQ